MAEGIKSVLIGAVVGSVASVGLAHWLNAGEQGSQDVQQLRTDMAVMQSGFATIKDGMLREIDRGRQRDEDMQDLKTEFAARVQEFRTSVEAHAKADITAHAVMQRHLDKIEERLP